MSIGNPIDIVYLTRRNLLTLLSKLDRKAAGDQSDATILKRDTVHPKYPQTMDILAVVAIEDDEYYVDRNPGEVHPADEARIRPK